MPAPKTKTRQVPATATRREPRPRSEPDRSNFINPWNNRALLDYYLDLLRAYGYIRLLGLPQIKDNPDIPIEALFVEPEFSETLITPDMAVEQWPPRINIANALSRTQRLVILGDPGMGKTSLLQWLVTQFCRNGASQMQERFGPLVPFPFILRDLPLSTDLGWEHLLELFLAQPIARVLRSDRGLVGKLLDTGQALIMLDGLDEVSSEDVKKALREMVLRGIVRRKSCRWLLTSRVVGYDRVPFHEFQEVQIVSPEYDPVVSFASPYAALSSREMAKDEALTHDFLADSEVLYLAPFNERQIESLVRNWYAEREADPAKRTNSIKELLGAIHDHSGTERLARIPNLLTMIALIHRVRARLPQGRVNLYTDIAEAYLQTIDDFKGIHEVDYSLAQKKQWLAHIAFEMQSRRQEQFGTSQGPDKSPGILVGRDDVLRWLTDTIDVVSASDRTSAAARFLDYIQRRTGLFIERSPGSFSFLHLSFQEYFAACYLAEEVTSPDWLSPNYDQRGTRPEDLRRYVTQPAWKETLVYLFELLGQERPRWVQAVAREVFADTLERPHHIEAADAETEVVFREQEGTDLILLAELSVDPYSGFPQALRELSWAAVWRCSFPEGTWVMSNPSADALFAGASQFREGIWPALARVAETLYKSPLNLTTCQHLFDVSPICQVKALERLDLWRSNIKEGLAQLANLPNLRSIELDWPGELKNPADLGKLVGLESLQLRCSGAELSVGRIPLLPKVTALVFGEYKKVVDPEAIAMWSQLEHIGLWPQYFTEETGVDAFSCLRHLPRVRRVSVGNSSLGRLDELPLGGPIEDLVVVDWQELEELGASQYMQGLKSLDLTRCSKISDLSPLAGFKNLEVLELESCGALKSLAPLTACPSLKEIKVRDCENLTDVPSEIKKLVTFSNRAYQ